ncbi:hypothetical protein [Butyrivibrio sp. AE3004]|uniref:hypothetical protein n=1 Tax=Butyrivibrio sp. AE3004 TaxID=1506994 RepID=UPI000493EAF0|nr:hypothetical protein [Butyrivibrio sp. AE3004]
MKDFEALKEKSLSDVKNAGIKIGKIVSWEINTRAKTRWGQCKKNIDGTYAIQISSTLLTDDRISEKAVLETMIHEILHTCENGMNHQGNWKINAEIMNRTYGYNIKRITKGSEKGVEDYKSKPREIKYIFTCKGCGVQIYRKRDSKFTRNYRNYCCARCGAVAWSRKSVQRQ